MFMNPLLSDEELDRLEALSQRGSPAPWRAIVEGRDQTSGDSFIQIDGLEDMYVSRDSGPAVADDLDLIAEARTMLPILIEELRSLRGLRS
jgi:hypothetical protein